MLWTVAELESPKGKGTVCEIRSQNESGLSPKNVVRTCLGEFLASTFVNDVIATLSA